MWVFLCQQVWAKCKSVRRWLCSWQWILGALVVLIIPRYLRQRLAVKLLYRNLKYIKLQGKWYCCRSCCKEGFLPLSAGHKVTIAALDLRAFPYGQRASSQSIGWRDGAYVKVEHRWIHRRGGMMKKEPRLRWRCTKSSRVLVRDLLPAWSLKRLQSSESFAGSSATSRSWMGRPEWLGGLLPSPCPHGAPWDTIHRLLGDLWGTGGASLSVCTLVSQGSFSVRKMSARFSRHLKPSKVLVSPHCWSNH